MTEDFFRKVTEVVILKLEGGYFHPDMRTKSPKKFGPYHRSGETMFGLDRHAGHDLYYKTKRKSDDVINNLSFIYSDTYKYISKESEEFWTTIDKANARKNWDWLYKGGSKETRLRQLAATIMYPQYLRHSKNYLSEKSRQIVASDPRLAFHFSYACWNGSGWFQKFANKFNEAVKSGTTSPNALLEVALNSRINSGVKLISGGGEKIKKFIYNVNFDGIPASSGGESSAQVDPEQQQNDPEIQPVPTPPPPPDPRLQGSLRLEKVSGPGNIMGQIEAEVIFGEVIFGDIQFDEPGDYVIRAVPSDSNVDPLEFLITALVNDNPPSEEKPQQEITGKRSIITQIDPPAVQLEPIKFPVLDNAVDENAQTLSQIGLTPFVWYNGFQIKETAIFNLQVFYNGFVPQCTIKFADLSGFLKKQGMPLADSTFDIFINSNSAVIKSIHLRFRIIDFKQNKDGSYTMSGQLNLRDFHKVNWKSYKGTSFETLRKISTELQLGFNSNINNTDDLMTWTNTGIKYQNFISEIIAHSYISDTSFVAGYIDFYYGLTFVDIEKEWSRDVANDFGIDTGGLTTLNKEKKDTETQLSPLVLTNDIAMNYSNMYFERYTVQNFATNKSMESGHYTVTKYYDVNSKQFLIFDVNSETTQSDDQLILKGKPGDSEEIQTNYSTIYGGKVDLSNVHKNYLYAEAANHRNLNDMAKIVLTFQMPNPNFNLYKFQKIRIVFRNPAPSVVEEDMEQQRISGNWMIVDIAFVWNGGRIYQTVKAIRRELEKTVEEKQTQEVIKEEPIKEGNVNEQVTETPPNSIYKVDEVYIVEDASGKQYEVTVKEILDNGNEISGWLWEI